MSAEPVGDESNDLVPLLDECYGLVTGAVSYLGPRDLLRATHLEAWTVQDLLFHQLLDAQRALMAFAQPIEDSADTDAVSYWKGFTRQTSPEEEAAHARYVRLSAAAYGPGDGLVRHWTDLSTAALNAAHRTPPAVRVRTQGHVLTARDFVHTLVVEASVHYLDLTVRLDAAPPPMRGLSLVREVLEGLLASPLPARWDDVEAALKGTGRVELSAEDRQDLGYLAGGFPVFG
ncbi:MAG TPA: maleylpyruvate isomerase N-terminal domain-containing protein [Dermatophilaceae bacterium]|nr:maleylpyruvate isomerase N-terminal domain-containing protein [Dermatophilaceae bacterium]